MTPTQKYTAFTNHKGEQIDVTGEVYDQPIKTTEAVQLYTQIKFLHKGIEVLPTRYFAEELSFNDLKKNVDYFTKNIKKELDEFSKK